MIWFTKSKKEILKNFLGKARVSLQKDDYTAFLSTLEDAERLSDYVLPCDNVTFESDNIVKITSDQVLDTSDPMNIAKYKNNLKLLVEDAKKAGLVDKFMVIRNDDFFPYDWQWRVASKDTAIELPKSSFSYQLRRELAIKKAGYDSDISAKDSFFNDIFVPEDEIRNQLSMMGENVGRIASPVHFRSTKHFTVNTPLSYTGEYNWVDNDRTFTILDSMDNFLNSGYAYSASYVDAYLDITHEGLPISNQAIVLIEEERYQQLIGNHNLMNYLKDRKVVVYRGDSAVAINMILTEIGVLPARPGNRYMTYDLETLEILENSMKSLCEQNGIAYHQGHGNIFGKGGHFSDNYDGLNYDCEKYQQQFLNFLKEQVPECRDVLSLIIFRDSEAARRAIQLIGVERLLMLVEQYNQLSEKALEERYQLYKQDRLTITEDISNIFKRTVKAIDTRYKNPDDTIDLEDKNLIKIFFHASRVNEQLLAATTLCQKWGISLEPDLSLNTYVY